MPIYEVTDPTTGQTLELEGDSPPTEAELIQIFGTISQQGAQPEDAAAPANIPRRGGGRAANARVLAANRATKREAFLSTLSPADRSLIEDIGGGEAALIGAGRGLTTLGRAVGIAEPEDPAVTQSIENLRKLQPALTAGEIAGEAAPFLLPGGAIAKIASVPLRAAATGVLGATEGGLIAKGQGRSAGEVFVSAGIGGTVAGALELGLPVLGRVAGAFVRKVTGKPPQGALIDPAGNPTQELQESLRVEGLSFDALTSETIATLKASPGAVPEQAARAARFQQEGVPFTTGDVTQGLEQQATEARLFESTTDAQADKLRQFRLKQSEKIRENLEQSIDLAKTPEDTGDLIKSALSGQRKLMRTEKNELYNQAGEAAKDAGGIPLFNDDITDAIPDLETLEDLAITAPEAMSKLDNLLMKFGVKEPTDKMLDAGFEAAPLTLLNSERFRKNLNAIERGDQTGASSVAIGDIRNALDGELDNLASSASLTNLPEKVVSTLKEARKATRKLKTEFSPQAFAGRLTDVKRDGVTPIVEASKVYSRLTGKGEPVENTRKMMALLRGDGEKGTQAIADLQSTVMLDLISAGFGTTSRKIDGIPTFNPGAFIKRMDAIGKDKFTAIFKDNPEAIKRMRNIRKIAKDITPQGSAVPKGSASVILDLANKIGLTALTAKFPPTALIVEAVRGVGQSATGRKETAQALAGSPETVKALGLIDERFPGLSSALGATRGPVLAAGSVSLAQQTQAQEQE